ncbi:Uma2 family endonuclease [Streptomyces sioyaensis]|uniref:Uma2 family endonuclease n=1 Tax=Streptomyces sioyaensis TaxID=67364 RepID=UPI0037B90759
MRYASWRPRAGWSAASHAGRTANPENDTDKKGKKYAQAGIPYYLIVNPIEGKCLLYSLPSGTHYRALREADFGEPVPIGAPVDAELDTTVLYTY